LGVYCWGLPDVARDGKEAPMKMNLMINLSAIGANQTGYERPGEGCAS
jgi:hypothetical protein